MAIAQTYIQLQRQIADELGDRTDLLSPLSDSGLTLSPIQNAIQSAIAKWEREPFYFNEYYGDAGAHTHWTFTTVAGQEFYTTSGEGSTVRSGGAILGNQLQNSPYFLRLHITISSNRYPLQSRTWAYLEDTSVNPSVTGQPIDFSYYDETLRLYPIPDGAYPVSITLILRYSPLVNPTDGNVWTEDGFDLIRSEAKLILAREVLFDDDLAARMELAIYGRSSIGGAVGFVPAQRGYLSVLKGESTRRARARITPSYFSFLGIVPLLHHLAGVF